MTIYLYLNNQQVGPYAEAQLRSMVAKDSISLTELAWHDGLPGWQPLNTILAFSPVASPAPIPQVPLTPVKLQRGLIRCKACGNPVSKKAKACPSCGAPIKHRTGCGGCLGIIGVLFIAGVVASALSRNSNLVSAPPTQQPQVSASTSHSAPNSTPAPANAVPQPEPTEASLDSFVRQVHDNYGLLDTVDGKQYVNVTVTKVDPSGISFVCDGGAATVAFEQFPDNRLPDIKKIYNFDPALAAAYRNAQSEYADIKAKKDAEDQAFKAKNDAMIKSVDDSARRVSGKILQVITVPAGATFVKGYLVSLDVNEDQLIVLIGTKESFVDGDRFPDTADGDGTVYYIGTMQYTSVLGASKTVRIYSPDRDLAIGIAAMSTMSQ